MSIRLTDTQRQIVDYGEGALLVVAGPGSGKTRVLTERVRRLLANSEGHFRVLALTFTNKAANEMAERLEDVPDIRRRAFIGTLHSFCMEVLANRGKAVGIDGLPHIFESFQDRRQVLADAVSGDPELSDILAECKDTRDRSKLLDNWLTLISEAKNGLLIPETLADERLSRVYELYDAALRASSAVDFDDLLLLTYRLFEESPKVADFYRRQYRYICIDEAQDLNEAQFQVLRALCGPDYRNVMMVGDPKQAIYVWNGADPKYLSMFTREFGATVVDMNENFRCSKAVVAAARALDASYKVAGQLPIRGQLELHALPDEKGEASYVIDEISRLTAEGHADIEGEVSLERCAVLGRNRFVFGELEAQLRDSGIPHYKKLSAVPLETGSTLVEEFELALRLLANPSDRLHLGVLAKRWGIALGINDMLSSVTLNGMDVLGTLASAATAGCHQEVSEAVRAMRWTPEDFSLGGALDWMERMAEDLPDEERAGILQDTREWRKHWDYYVRSEPGGHHSLSAFLAQVALGSTQQPRQEGLVLLTVHSAKGMEFDVVFVIGMCEGTFPDYRATTDAQLAEEARNAFVAVTRSKRLLYLTFPRQKTMPWGAVKLQKASRYLRMIHGATAGEESPS